MTRSTLGCVLLLSGTVLFAQERSRPVPFNGDIASPGKYMLVSDTSNGITITADDVTLDLNGFSINGPGGKSGTGIHIQGASGVAVQGGSIHDFAFGVIVENSRNVTVKDLRIRAEGLPVVTLPPETGIMIVESTNVVVEDNAIYNVGLGIFVRGGRSGGNRIANNTVTAGTNGVLGICYNPAPGDPLGPRGDLITGNVSSGFQTAMSVSDMSESNAIQGNTFLYRTNGYVSANDTNLNMDNIEIQLP